MGITPPPRAKSAPTSFEKLHNAARTLNSVTDELGNAIAQIEESLRKLNLGVSAWVEVSSGDDSFEGGDSYWSEEIGYTKYGGKWCICLRRLVGSQLHGPDEESTQMWAFNDTTRTQRLAALDKITPLLEKLSKEADKMTERVRSRLDQVQEVANTLSRQPIAPRPVTARDTGGVK